MRVLLFAAPQRYQGFAVLSAVHASHGFINGYERGKQNLLFNKINDNYLVKLGDIVSTSGMNPNIPSGILIGTVSGMSKDVYDLTTIIKVKSKQNWDNITYVSVLVRKDKS